MQEALWTNLQRRSMYGDNEEVLERISNVHADVLAELDKELATVAAEIAREEDYYAPAVTPAELPDPPLKIHDDAAAAAALVTETIPNVLQLSKRKEPPQQQGKKAS